MFDPGAGSAPYAGFKLMLSVPDQIQLLNLDTPEDWKCRDPRNSNQWLSPGHSSTQVLQNVPRPFTLECEMQSPHPVGRGAYFGRDSWSSAPMLRTGGWTGTGNLEEVCAVVESLHEGSPGFAERTGADANNTSCVTARP